VPGEEAALVKRLAGLDFKPFEFQGYVGKRRVVSFGWRYDFNLMRVEEAAEIPDFLVPLRERAAAFAGISPSALQQVLLTEYGAGAGIGWHKDRSVFAEVVGISLLAPCIFRLRRKAGAKPRPGGEAGRGRARPGKAAESWERLSVALAPCSAYLISGPARTEWEHSIPAVDALRYSVTFRSLAQT
jgi:alkylated DNA repair dioxygenase AlkB